jgi:membrane protease YdiL (CAAX protease family)
MFQSAVSNGLLLVLVPAFVRLTSRARLDDLGLHWKAWPRQVGIGVRAAMLMTPPVCAVQFVTTRIWRSQTHPVEQMVLENLTFEVAILAVLSTMVLAPLIEELLFRGILQRWLERFVDGGSLQAKTSQDSEQFVTPKPWNESTLSDPEYEQPRSIPIDAGSELLHRGNHSVEVPVSPSLQLPILFTSIIFAAMHLPQWPAPLAIFLLSMALGTVYQRTGSLLASVAMHATFNGINTMVLFLLAALGQRIQAPIEPAATAFSVLNLLSDILFSMSFT